MTVPSHHRTTRLLLVDDSPAMRALLRELLSSAADIEVVGEAGDPYEARERIKALNPDVITLDVEMPRMDGLSFLDNLMRLRPMPVVMFSSLTARGASASMSALALGAVAVLQKPRGTSDAELAESAAALIDAVRGAAQSRPRRKSDVAAVSTAPSKFPDTELPARRFCLIGASTGGTEAIRDLLAAWPLRDVAVLISQHIPPAFSAPFAERLDRHSPLHVRHAVSGRPLMAGHAYVAPGGQHLRLARAGTGYTLLLGDDAPVNRHRPSVDVMFESAVPYARDCVVAMLLTGMGDDGARGLLALREAGVRTLAQDEASSVVWGMPGAAARLGAVDEILPLDRMADALVTRISTDATLKSRPARPIV
jgi:two-component system chemotaxis response regulator CheB